MKWTIWTGSCFWIASSTLRRTPFGEKPTCNAKPHLDTTETQKCHRDTEEVVERLCVSVECCGLCGVARNDGASFQEGSITVRRGTREISPALRARRKRSRSASWQGGESVSDSSLAYMPMNWRGGGGVG